MLEVDTKLIKGNIATEKVLTHAAKGAQAVATPCPHAFHRTGMHFSKPVTVIVAQPFFLPMSHRGAGALNAAGAVLLIRVNRGSFSGELLDLPRQGGWFAISHHPQSSRSALASHRAPHGRTVIGNVPDPPRLFARQRGGSSGSKCSTPFFPHSETSHHFQKPCREGGYRVGGAGRGHEPAVATSRSFGSLTLVPG